MRSALRTLFLATAAVTAAVVLYVGATTPPRALDLSGNVPATSVIGAYRIHTARSDGTGTLDDVARAARAAGLQFIIVTDHGDGTRVPDPPAYRSGVLCVDALEVNTSGGHVVALGLTGATPYPLAGNAADVLEDIHRLGGVAVIAHPDSPNAALRWRAMNAPFDGVEWQNADSEWRDEKPSRLILTAAWSFFRAPESVATVFGSPARSLARLDAAARGRAVFGLAALDAHANIPWRDDEEPRRHTGLAWPTYRSMFLALTQTVTLDRPLTGVASDDAGHVLDAIRRGHSFSVVRAFARPGLLQFTAEQGSQRAAMGDRLIATGTDTVFHAGVADAPGARVTLLRDGQPVVSAPGRVDHADRIAGVYRVEVTLPGRATPWIVSNPIVVAPAALPVGPGRTEAADDPAVEWVPLAAEPWAIERDPSSSGTLSVDGAEMRMTFHLAPGQARGQYAALVGGISSSAGVDRVRFVGRASRPMRVSLQVRLPRGGNASRWRRSVYLDTTPRPVSVRIDDFEPADGATSRRPIVTPLHSVLFVVDTLNTATGSDGSVWISEVALGTRRLE